MEKIGSERGGNPIDTFGVIAVVLFSIFLGLLPVAFFVYPYWLQQQSARAVEAKTYGMTLLIFALMILSGYVAFYV